MSTDKDGVEREGSNWIQDPLSHLADIHERSLPAKRGKQRFNSGEHLWLGGRGARLACDQFVAKGAEDFSSCFSAISRADGRHQLDYGEVVALSGDFYGSPTDLFDEQNPLLSWPRKQNNLPSLREIFAEELKWIEDRRTGSSGTSYPLDEVGMFWSAKSYVELALHNHSHFGWHNVLAYCRYHQEALQLALTARGRKDATFRRALYTNAFADHFLTDGFAAGHIRVPRLQIIDWGAEVGHDLKLAGALSKCLHDQDGHMDLASIHGLVDEERRPDHDGLWVSNSTGLHWHTRCDGQLFLNRDAREATHIEQPTLAVAASVRELLEAWQQGELPRDVYAATSFVPFPHLEAPKLIEKFPADLSEERFEALYAAMAWYSKIPWIGPGLRKQHLRDLLLALPTLMEAFRLQVARDCQMEADLVRRIAPPYVRAFREVA